MEQRTRVGVAVRPVTPADQRAVEAMWDRCSEASRRERFHGVMLGFPGAALGLDDGATTVVAAEGQVVVGVATLRDGELGVLVEDAWQGRGLGSRLVADLVAGARTAGLDAVRAVVPADRPRLLGALRRLPVTLSGTLDGTTLVVRLELVA